MPRKRKICKARDEPWEEEEVGHEDPAGIQLREETFIPTLPVSQSYDPETMGEAAGICKDSFQQSGEGASFMPNACNLDSEVVASESDESNSHSCRRVKSRKTRGISQEARLKKITVTCEWNMCTMEFNKVESFMSHITEHLQVITGPVSNDGYLCFWRECDFACNTKKELDCHVYYHAHHGKIKSIGSVLMEERNEKCILDSSGRNLIPEIPDFFQCKWKDCSVQFASAHDFYCHALGHAGLTGEKSYKCSWDGCSSSFRAYTRLKNHVRRHTQERVVGCPNCGGIYTSNDSFLDHCVRQMPVETQQYECSYCLRRFPHEKLLRCHVRHHIRSYKCHLCEMTVESKASLADHISRRHEKRKSHHCSLCGKGFTCQSDLSRHFATHFEEPVNKCPYHNCTFKCRALGTLNRHMKVVHQGIDQHHYACHLCDSRYTTGNPLSEHLIKVHNFTYPPGHTRFRYKQEEDGFFRLETIRYNRIISEGEEDEEEVDSPEASSACPSSPALSDHSK